MNSSSGSRGFSRQWRPRASSFPSRARCVRCFLQSSTNLARELMPARERAMQKKGKRPFEGEIEKPISFLAFSAPGFFCISTTEWQFYGWDNRMSDEFPSAAPVKIDRYDLVLHK